MISFSVVGRFKAGEAQEKAFKEEVNLCSSKGTAYFTQYRTDCGLNCSFRALNLNHFHCNVCSWKCSRVNRLEFNSSYCMSFSSSSVMCFILKTGQPCEHNSDHQLKNKPI